MQIYDKAIKQPKFSECGGYLQGNPDCAFHQWLRGAGREAMDPETRYKPTSSNNNYPSLEHIKNPCQIHVLD